MEEERVRVENLELQIALEKKSGEERLQKEMQRW